MANKPVKKTTKPAQTMRQKAAIEPAKKRRLVRSTASRVGRSTKVLKPLAKPFQIKPVKKTGHIVGLIIWPRFIRNAWKELVQVEWPGRKETIKLTTAVFIFAIVFGLIIAISDFGLDRVFKKLLL